MLTGTVSTKVVQNNCEMSFFFHFLQFFSVTYDHVGTKVSNNMSSERTNKIHLNSCVLLRGNSSKVAQRAVKFQIIILNFCYFFSFFVCVQNLEKSDWGERIKIGTSGASIKCVWDTF